MAPTFHLVRHGQGFHNLCKENEMLPDPEITPLGKQQCAELRAAFPFHDQITRIVSSPMRRTLYTSFYSFGRDNLYPITALASLQEVSDLPSDTGSAVSALQKEFGSKVDLSRVSENWVDKTVTSPFQANVPKLEVRAREARLQLRELASHENNDHIVVITHGDFLHFLTDDWQGVPELDFYVWKNCEYRSYQFNETTGRDEEAWLTETPDSRTRRHGDAKLPTPKQQDEWRTIVYKKLETLYATMG